MHGLPHHRERLRRNKDSFCLINCAVSSSVVTGTVTVIIHRVISRTDSLSFPIAVQGILSIMHGCEIGTNAILIRSVVVVRITVVVHIREVRRRNFSKATQLLLFGLCGCLNVR